MTPSPNDELVFLPLGGSNEIGMNFNLYGYGPPHARKWIVVDLGRLTASSLATLEETKDLFVVTTPGLPALFETNRLLKRLLDAGFPRDKLHLLLNQRARLAQRAGISKHQDGHTVDFYRVTLSTRPLPIFREKWTKLSPRAGFWTRIWQSAKPSLR